MARTDLSVCASLRPAPQLFCPSAGANRPIPVTFADQAGVPGVLGVIGPSAGSPEKPAELWTCAAGLRRRRPSCGGPRGQSAAGAGLLAAGTLCLQLTPVHAAGAASQRVLLLPAASDSQGAYCTTPTCPQVHLAPAFFFSRRLPLGSVSLSLWTPSLSFVQPILFGTFAMPLKYRVNETEVSMASGGETAISGWEGRLRAHPEAPRDPQSP